MAETQPSRIGIVGDHPAGRFVLESLAVHTAHELVHYQNDWHRFLSSPGMEAVFFFGATPSDEQKIKDVISAGSIAVIQPPVIGTVRAWAPLLQSHADRVCVWSDHSGDSDFLAAHQWVAEHPNQSLSAVTRIAWVPKLVEPPPEHADSTWFETLFWGDVDQALQLMKQSPSSVFAGRFEPSGEIYSILLNFPGNVSVHLERRRGLAVGLDVGWTLAGPTGGYARGREFRQTEAGEIFDVAVKGTAPHSDTLQNRLRDLSNANRNRASCERALQILKIRDAVRRSVETQAMVEMG